MGKGQLGLQQGELLTTRAKRTHLETGLDGSTSGLLLAHSSIPSTALLGFSCSRVLLYAWSLYVMVQSGLLISVNLHGNPVSGQKEVHWGSYLGKRQAEAKVKGRQVCIFSFPRSNAHSSSWWWEEAPLE